MTSKTDTQSGHLHKEFYSMQRKFIEESAKKYNSGFSNMIIERLKCGGYEFANENELAEFARTRCQIISYPDKRKEFYADDKLVAWWWDTVEVKMEFVDKATVKATMIFGKEP